MMGAGADSVVGELEGAGEDSVVVGAGELEGAGEELVLVEVEVEPLPSCIHQPPLSLIQ